MTVRAAGAARERGFALLIVLWTLVLVSLIVLRLTEAGSAAARLGGNLRRAAVAETEADGALEEACFRLATSRAPLPGAGGFTIPTPHGTAAVRFTTEAGKVDLNNASPPILGALIETVGADANTAAAVAAAIVAWHTSVPGPQMGALEAPYRAAGRRFGPPATRFESVDELRLVLGMTPALFDGLRPHLTVFGSGDPDLAFADPVIRRAAASVGQNASAIPSPNGAGSVFSLRVDERVAGARFVRSAIVEFEAGDDASPWRVLTLGRSSEPDGAT